MDKYLEVFAKQNPKMEFKCQADGCGRAYKFSTKKVLSSGDTFSFECPACGNQSHMTGLNKFKKDLIKQFKDLGLTVR